MKEAFRLLVQGDPETWAIIGRSISFSFFATFFSLFPGLPLGILLAWKRTKGRQAWASIVASITALPTVVIGLFVYSMISRSGPFGNSRFLYSPSGVVLGQFFLAAPLVISTVFTGLSKLDARFKETLQTLGAPPLFRLFATLKEGKTVLAAAIVMAFGRVIGEVGVSMMLGGNIRNYTRTMTTAIALDASKGEFERALSLGMVLFILAIAINSAVYGLVHGDE
jgi:tungstate transport system permease protein